MIVYALVMPLAIGPDAAARSLAAIAFADKGTIQVEEYPLLQVPNPNYPLLVPLALAFLFLFQPGPVSLFAENVKIIFPLFYLSLLGIFFFRLKTRVKPPVLALLSTVILGTTPFLVYMGSVFNLNLPGAVYLFVGCVYLYSWWEGEQTADNLWLPGAMLGFFAWTRFEGLLFGLAPLAFVIWLGFRLPPQRQDRSGWQLFLPYTLIACSWGLYRRWRWASYGQLAIISDVDLLLILVVGVLILGYMLFMLYCFRPAWSTRLIRYLSLIVPGSILLSGAAVGWCFARDWHLGKDWATPLSTSWRLQMLYRHFTRPEWGGLAYLTMLLPFLVRKVVRMWYLWVLPLWIFLIWILVYVIGTWWIKPSFIYWTADANRILLCFYPLFLFAITRLLTSDVAT